MASKQCRKRVRGRDFQRDTIAAMRADGDQNVHFLDGARLLGQDWEECTVDGTHPNDLGFMRMAERLTPALKALLD
jgi:lysophospholipase L1-like esterase